MLSRDLSWQDEDAGKTKTNNKIDHWADKLTIILADKTKTMIGWQDQDLVCQDLDEELDWQDQDLGWQKQDQDPDKRDQEQARPDVNRETFWIRGPSTSLISPISRLISESLHIKITAWDLAEQKRLDRLTEIVDEYFCPSEQIWNDVPAVISQTRT